MEHCLSRWRLGDRDLSHALQGSIRPACFIRTNPAVGNGYAAHPVSATLN